MTGNRKGCKPWNKGLSKETDIRLATSGKKISTSNIGRISPMKDKHHTQEAKDKCGRSMKGKHHTQESRDMMRKTAWNKGLTKEIDVRLNHTSLVQKGKKHLYSWNRGLTKDTDSRVMLQALKLIERFKDPEFMKKILHRRAPSGEENKFSKISESSNLDYKYVGNGELTIDGKNPDFVSITNDHKLIEIWGDYYKKGRDPQDLIDFYMIRGYQCIVIWASELRHPEEVMEKVRKFNAY